MLENAKMNQEQFGCDSRTPMSCINPIPRTSTINKAKLENVSPHEFANDLTSRLEALIRSREQQEKINQSFKKLQEVSYDISFFII